MYVEGERCVASSCQEKSFEKGSKMSRKLSIVEAKIAELWMNDTFREQEIYEAANDYESQEEE